MNQAMRRLIGPGVFSLLGVGILIGLGVWQLERLGWKRDILLHIDRAEAGPAVPLGTDPPPFAKVRVQGVFRLQPVALYGADVELTPAGAKMGARQIMLLERQGARPVLVDRGWVPLEPIRPIAQPRGVVTIEGYVRASESPGLFSPTDDLATRHFYTLDARAIGTALGAPEAAPFVVVALGPRPTEMFPIPAQRLPRPPNDHLNYAITWFGLAFILAVIFVIHARSVLRS